MIVIDASAAVALLLNEDTAFGTIEFFPSLTEDTVIAPSHWGAEVGNALVINVRRGRLGVADIRIMIERLHTLGIQLASPPSFTEITAISNQAIALGLTYYDAAYVHMAQSLQASLLALDRKMREAASRFDVPLLPR